MSVLSFSEPTYLMQLEKLMTSLRMRKRRQSRRWKMELRKKLRILFIRSQSHSPNFTRIQWYRPQRMWRWVCEWHVRRKRAQRKIQYLRSLSIEPTTPAASVFAFNNPYNCQKVSKSAVEVYSSSLAAGLLGSQFCRRGGKTNLSLRRASSSRMSLSSTLLLTNSSYFSRRRPQSNSSFQLLNRKANSLAKVRSKERSNYSPDRNSSHSKSQRHRERCSVSPAFLSATSNENSATPCLDLSPLRTKVSTRFLTKLMLFRGLVRLLSFSTKIPPFVKKPSTNNSICARCTAPSVLLYYSYSAVSPLLSRRYDSGRGTSFPCIGLRSRCNLNLHCSCETAEKSPPKRGIADQSLKLPRVNC